MTGKPYSKFCGLFSVVPYLLLCLLFISATAAGDEQRAEDAARHLVDLHLRVPHGVQQRLRLAVLLQLRAALVHL